jgi:NitT/TauT family transport system substrate-binding protein
VDVQSVQGDQLVTAALVSGDIQFGEIGVAAGMAAVAQGGNLKFLVAGTPKLDALLAAKGLKDPKELQGKAFGISAPGSVSDASARLALQKLGGTSARSISCPSAASATGPKPSTPARLPRRGCRA